MGHITYPSSSSGSSSSTSSSSAGGGFSSGFSSGGSSSSGGGGGGSRSSSSSSSSFSCSSSSATSASIIAGTVQGPYHAGLVVDTRYGNIYGVDICDTDNWYLFIYNYLLHVYHIHCELYVNYAYTYS